MLPLRCSGLEVSPVTHEHAISDSPRHDTDVLKMYYVRLVTNVFVAHICVCKSSMGGSAKMDLAERCMLSMELAL